jgi:hypothetical protein
VTLRGAEADEAPIGQEEEAPPVGHQVLRVKGRTSREEEACDSSGELELIVEVARVGEDRPIAHLGKSAAPHTFRLPVAAMTISHLGGGRCHDPKVHRGLEGADQCDLDNCHDAAHAGRTDAMPRLTQPSRRSPPASRRSARWWRRMPSTRLAGPVAVVEEVRLV